MAAQPDVGTLRYEEALAELESLIARLERGDVALDEAVACYQRGSALAQRCTELLDRTESTVMQLVVGAGGVEEERPLAVLRDEPGAGRGGGGGAGSSRPAAERPTAPPPPGSPARARGVPTGSRAAPGTSQDRPPAPSPEVRPPARPPQRPAAPAQDPGLFPGLEPVADDQEADFDLDDIPF